MIATEESQILLKPDLLMVKISALKKMTLRASEPHQKPPPSLHPKPTQEDVRHKGFHLIIIIIVIIIIITAAATLRRLVYIRPVISR